LDPYPAGDRDHPGDLKPVEYYLDPLFIKNRKDSLPGCLSCFILAEE
jgi:hypothetical protein